MRELSSDELDKVNGGAGAVGAAIGGIAGGVSGAINGDGIGDVVKGATFGAASGFFGGIASATTGFGRAAFGAYSVEMAVLGNTHS